MIVLETKSNSYVWSRTDQIGLICKKAKYSPTCEGAGEVWQVLKSCTRLSAYASATTSPSHVLARITHTHVHSSFTYVYDFLGARVWRPRLDPD